MGSKEPKWYQGPNQEKNKVLNSINYGIDCTKYQYKKEKNTIILHYVNGEKKIGGKWAFTRKNRSIHAYAQGQLGGDEYHIYLAKDPNKDCCADEEVLHHEIGHVILFDIPKLTGHPSQFKQCYFNWWAIDNHESHDIYHLFEDLDGNIISDYSENSPYFYDE